MKRVALALLALTMSLITTLTFAATEETVRKGGFNSVILYTPTTLSPVGNGRSLMVVLHGCTQPTLNFKTANLDKAADEHGMVIAVPDAVYKEGFQCWGYWTGMPSRTYNDYKNILNLVSELLSDATYNIDPNQVYIAGLSSGGAFAMETGCLAPDVFAGMGLVGAPSAGTGAMGAFSHEGTVASVKSNCNSTAGSNASHFNTQVTVSAYGTSDTTVPQSYGPQNAKAMAGVYGHSEPSEVKATPGLEVQVLLVHLSATKPSTMPAIWVSGLHKTIVVSPIVVMETGIPMAMAMATTTNFQPSLSMFP
jgi:poly(hydroxyalkanoate) depolymerase family esterase